VVVAVVDALLAIRPMLAICWRLVGGIANTENPSAATGFTD